MLLSARFIKKPRKSWRCDSCGGYLDHHIYMYGAADVNDKPSAMRVHRKCCEGWQHPKLQKAVAACRAYEGSRP